MLSGREIARLTGMNPQSTLNYLTDLAKSKVLVKNKKGNLVLYSLHEGFVAKIYLDLAEYKVALASLKNKELNVLVDELLPLTESLVLFGSYAKDKQTKESDIDLIAVGKSKKEAIQSAVKRYPREVNVEFVSYSSFDKTKNTALGKEIFKNHIIYGDVYRIVEIWRK